MILTIPFIILGFFLLFKGGDFLVTGAAGIAQKKNIPAFIVGITLVAFGTSAPELFFNIISALHGNTEFALSNVSGSNLINIAVGIGVSAMVSPLAVTRQKFSKDLSFLCAGPILAAACVFFSPTEALHIGHGMLLFIGFGLYIYLTGKKMAAHNQQAHASAAENCTADSCRREWLIFAVGCAMLYVGGEVIYRNALKIVSYFGLSESMVGLTVIAVGTSIPDCAASIIATAKKQKDIAIGNILGSNIFNIFLVLASTIVVFGQPVAFSTSNYFDYGSVAVLSILFAAHSLFHQTIGRAMGVFLLLCYPAILYIRIAFFNA
ncbi:MAG: calcium/sodium antiporter [Desulfobacterales bacterium]|nr:calcium/sodium antiporter [Desulfobacterales bacterium]